MQSGLNLLAFAKRSSSKIMNENHIKRITITQKSALVHRLLRTKSAVRISTNRQMRSLETTFFLCILLCLRATAQPTSIKNLVFEGAGIRGIAYAGVLSAMEEQGALAAVERGGTSAGAISSLLFALGYTPKEMEAIISQTKFQKSNDGRFFFIGGIARTKKRFSWYQGLFSAKKPPFDSNRVNRFASPYSTSPPNFRQPHRLVHRGKRRLDPD